MVSESVSVAEKIAGVSEGRMKSLTAVRFRGESLRVKMIAVAL
jgi:hypothetical protein